MLKRRRRIQKYINALKSKKHTLKSHPILKHTLENDNDQDDKVINEEQVNIMDRQDRQKQERLSRLHDKRMEKGKRIASLKTEFAKMEGETEEGVWHDSDDDDNTLRLQQKNMFKKLELPEETSIAQYQQKLKVFYQNRFSGKNWAVKGDGEFEKDL